MSAAIWPDNLPYPQVQSFSVEGPPYSQPIDVLTGPTRVRLMRRYAVETFAWEVWLTPEHAEDFEQWYSECVEFDNGEFYLPWIGGGRVLVFADEYTLVPLGRNWRLAATVTVTRIDRTLIDAHVCSRFGDRVYVDNGLSLNLLQADLAADLIILWLPGVFTECGLIRDPGSSTDIALHVPEGTDDSLIDDGVSSDIVIDDFPLEDIGPL